MIARLLLMDLLCYKRGPAYSPLPTQGCDIESLSGPSRCCSSRSIRRRTLKMVSALALLSLVSACVCLSIPPRARSPYASSSSSSSASFPSTHGTALPIHDPSIIKVDGTYYAYTVGTHILIYESSSLDGPWEQTGTVLDDLSVIPKGDRTAPWAPTVLQYNGKYYCYYSVSNAGCRDSAIGVATSSSPGPGSWTDHGVIVQTGTGEVSSEFPFNGSNAIDPSVLVDGDGTAYLSFGSYWSGIWQVPLGADLISTGSSADARHLAWEPTPIDGGGASSNPLCRDETGAHPIEGSFQSYHDGWYYLWYSHGKCCDMTANSLPPAGDEYNIRVGRSRSPQGPFVDSNGKDLVEGGGNIVYGSNGDVYAPGGQGVLVDGDSDILYYHYLNKSIGYAFGDAKLGYNTLTYIDGWPVAV